MGKPYVLFLQLQFPETFECGIGCGFSLSDSFFLFLDPSEFYTILKLSVLISSP